MMSHAFDIAVCNSWLEYMKDTNNLKRSQRKQQSY